VKKGVFCGFGCDMEGQILCLAKILDWLIQIEVKRELVDRIGRKDRSIYREKSHFTNKERFCMLPRDINKKKL
jgi:hypothetical protein